MSWVFGQKSPQICDAGMGQILRFWVKIYWEYYAFKWYRTDYRRHFISADWVYKWKFEILWVWSKIWDLLRILWVWVFGKKFPKICDAGMGQFLDLRWNNFGWFYAFKWSRSDHWRHLISIVQAGYIYAKVGDLLRILWVWCFG